MSIRSITLQDNHTDSSNICYKAYLCAGVQPVQILEVAHGSEKRNQS